MQTYGLNSFSVFSLSESMNIGIKWSSAEQQPVLLLMCNLRWMFWGLNYLTYKMVILC